MNNKTGNRVRLKQVRSKIGCLASHKATLLGLGLRKINHVVELEDTPCVRGMINKISYLLEIEKV